MIRIALLALMLGACSIPVPVSKDRLINVSVDAWDAKGLPYTQLCADSRERLVIDALDDPMEVCGEDMAGIVHGCFFPPTIDTGSPVLIVTTDPDWSADTVVHEAMHWLSWCGLGDGDSEHANPEVWSISGAYYEALARVIS